jgi:phosphonate transport system substrate-binding protein
MSFEGNSMRNRSENARTRPWRSAVLKICLIAAAILPQAAHCAEEALVLGVFPRYKPTETTTMYTPLAQHLSEQLGRKVVLVTSKDFDSFWHEVMERRYDIVHYNQYHYTRSAESYTVIGHSQEFGKNSVGGALFVRRDSGITDVSQLRGRKVIFGGGKDAMMSYIAPRFLLMQAGLNESDFKTEFAVNPPNALIALFHKQADAAGGGDILMDLPVVKKAIDTADVRILAATEPLLFLPWAVKRTMPAKLRQSIQTVLVDLATSERGKLALKAARTTGIGKAADKDYDPHRKMTHAVFGAPDGADRLSH